MYTHAYTCTYAYTRIHTQTHAYTHAYACTTDIGYRAMQEEEGSMMAKKYNKLLAMLTDQKEQQQRRAIAVHIAPPTESQVEFGHVMIHAHQERDKGQDYAGVTARTIVVTDGTSCVFHTPPHTHTHTHLHTHTHTATHKCINVRILKCQTVKKKQEWGQAGNTLPKFHRPCVRAC